MSTDPKRQPEGIPTGGQFAPDTRAEPSVSLAAPPAPSYDPDAVAKGILTDLWDLHTEWARKLVYDTRQSVQAGETTHEAFIDSLLAKNHGGRCAEHEFDTFDTEVYCEHCLTSLMVEARTNPKPLPVPQGVISAREQNHQLAAEAVARETEGSWSVETSRMTGDEKFDAAVRRMFQAPADATVEVIMEETEDWSTYTGHSATEITVKCDGRTAVYSHMGSLMKALDQARHDPHAMALRFMTADRAQRPLLKGIAAVYIRQAYGHPAPVFGKIRNVFSGADGQFMDFLHIDGRKQHIYLNGVSAILETNQSREYNEHPNVLPASAARPGKVIEKSIEPHGGKRELRAVVTTAELDAQVRGYLHVDDPAAGVTVRHEKVDFYGIDEKFILSCDGKETSFSSLEAFLRKVAN